MFRSRRVRRDFREGEFSIAGSGGRRNYAAEYAARIERRMAEGFTRSQAAGHPKQGEPSVSEVRSQARSIGQRVRDFLAMPPQQWRAGRGEQAPPPEPTPYEQVPVGDQFVPLPPEQLLPPEQRGFVVGPSFDDPYLQKAYDFGFADEYGNITDQRGADLLWQGWFNFQSLGFDDVYFTRSEFFDYTGLSWRDFDDWREYISEYLGAA